jgi:hypothetical protein
MPRTAAVKGGRATHNKELAAAIDLTTSVLDPLEDAINAVELPLSAAHEELLARIQGGVKQSLPVLSSSSSSDVDDEQSKQRPQKEYAWSLDEDYPRSPRRRAQWKTRRKLSARAVATAACEWWRTRTPAEKIVAVALLVIALYVLLTNQCCPHCDPIEHIPFRHGAAASTEPLGCDDHLLRMRPGFWLCTLRWSVTVLPLELLAQ